MSENQITIEYVIFSAHFSFISIYSLRVDILLNKILYFKPYFVLKYDLVPPLHVLPHHLQTKPKSLFKLCEINVISVSNCLQLM